MWTKKLSVISLICHKKLKQTNASVHLVKYIGSRSLSRAKKILPRCWRNVIQLEYKIVINREQIILIYIAPHL